MAVVKRMAEFLARAQHVSVTQDIGFDVVQEFGQKIEFGETRKIVLRRPDRLRVDETKRNGTKGGLVFDGKELTVFDTKDNVYATDARVAGAGTVDEAVVHVLLVQHCVRSPCPGAGIGVGVATGDNGVRRTGVRVREMERSDRVQRRAVGCQHTAARAGSKIGHRDPVTNAIGGSVG